MACNLCASPSSLPSSLYQPLFNSFSSSSSFSSAYSIAFKLPGLRPQSKPYLQLTHVSLHETPIQQSSKKDADLFTVIKDLNNIKLNKEEEVHLVLSRLGDDFPEQDAVKVINGIRNPRTALLVLRYFLGRLKIDREASLYTTTMKVLKNGKEMELVEQLFDEMLRRRISPSVFTFTTIMSCALLINSPHRAVEWFERMPSFGITPDAVAYSTAIEAYHLAGNLKMAVTLHECAKTGNWRLEDVGYSVLIKVHTSSGNYDECLNVYEEMKDRGVVPNMGTFYALIYAMALAKRPLQAEVFFKEMIDRGLEPSLATSVALLRAYGLARQGKDAIALYREIKKKGNVLAIQLYNVLLSMCADLGYVDEGKEIFEDMNRHNVELRDRSFSSLISLFASSGRVAEASSTLRSMIEAGFQPSISDFTLLIQCYGKARLTDDVVKMFNIVSELGLRPNDELCGCLLIMAAETPVEEAGELVDCIEKVNPILGYVVKLLMQGEQEMNFRKFVSDLLNSVDNPGLKKTICNSLLDLCLNLESYVRACELLDVAVTLEIYRDIQSRTPTQWSLHLKGLSYGAALTALHVWINDLSNEVERGESLPPELEIDAGHGETNGSDMSLLESHLKVIGAPFVKSPDEDVWFLATKDDAEAWLEARKAAEVAAA